MALCLSAGAASVKLAVSAFSLIWMHSIEKIDWQEDWRLADGQLQLVAAWVQGSGAGMEIPEGAERDGTRWRYHRDIRTAVLSLPRSAFTPDYQLCLPGQPCRPLAAWLPADPVLATEIRACDEREPAH